VSLRTRELTCRENRKAAILFDLVWDILRVREQENMLRLLRALREHHRFMLVPLVLALCSCSHRIPPEFEYSPGWISEEHPDARPHVLSGVVTDQSGAAIEHVLVERMTADFKTRIDARLTDSAGRFRFRWMRTGTYYLRCRYRAFDDYLISVKVSPKADNDSLHVQLVVSK
jgi:Carboxypeptidase regulatory-like domain